MVKLSLFIWMCLALLVIYLTPPPVALESDALGYYQDARTALSDGTLWRAWLSPSGYYGDYGYTFALGVVMAVTRTDNVVVLQAANYFFWLLTTVVVWRALTLLVGQLPGRKAAVLMLFSPVYLTFSAKLYSESFAALGASLLLLGGVALIQKKMRNLPYVLAYILGGIILVATKSAFLPLLLIPLIWSLTKRQYLLVGLTALIPLLTLSNIISAEGSTRSLLVSAIQTAKLRWSYQTIGACSLYYLSYPLGQTVFPGYQGACHPNNPTPEMPMVGENPYLLGAAAVEAGQYSGMSAWQSITKEPLKYSLLAVSNMSTIVWFEGVYPSILLRLPSFSWPFWYLIAKIGLSCYLWYHTFRYTRRLAHTSRAGALLILSPLLYFVLVFGNLHEEQRYFYPLIPYLYFLLGMSKGILTP